MAGKRKADVLLAIERLAFGGAGVARLSNGKICFVSGVIPGEKVRAQLRAERASYAEADLKEIIEPSPDRAKPKCPVYGRCGGCHYQHLSYAGQLAIKTQQLAEVLKRLGGVSNPPVEPIAPSPFQFHYRNRVTVHSRSGRVGFFRARSRRIVEVSHCPIATERVNALLRALRSSNPKDGEYPLREPSAFRGFRQVNDSVADCLAGIVEEMARPGGKLFVDAYCGAGFFAKRVAALFDQTIGIEWSTDAIRIARQGAGSREIYLSGDVKRHLVPALDAAPADGTTLLVDPPEEGVEKNVLETIRSRRPSRLIYVSCNPATLARDIRYLAGTYALKRVCPVDMFPQTAEIETAALLHRADWRTESRREGG
jgi:tRNA/tmRNA/rRNA uracil-C5-methylase (TrmA/RlmC/RlmD family)